MMFTLFLFNHQRKIEKEFHQVASYELAAIVLLRHDTSCGCPGPGAGRAGGGMISGGRQGGRGYSHNSLVAVFISTRDLPNETLHIPQPNSPPHPLTHTPHPQLHPHSHPSSYTSPPTLHLCTEVEDLQVCIEGMVQCVWWAVVPLGQSAEHFQHIVCHRALLVVLSQTAYELQELVMLFLHRTQQGRRAEWRKRQVGQGGK